MYGENQEQYLNKIPYAVTSYNQKGIQRLIGIFQYQLKHNTEYAYLEHYKTKHHNVPLWIMIQTLTLGQVSHMFDYLKAKVPIRVCNDFYRIGRKDMHSFLSVMTKHRNVCAHGERYFNYHTKDSITDTHVHKKLHILEQNDRYQYGKNDVFSEIIILKYLLDKEDFHNFYYELKRCFNRQNPGKDILQMMGFPENWMSVLRIKC